MTACYRQCSCLLFLHFVTWLCQCRAFNAGVSEENVVDTEFSDAAHDMELKPSYAALSEVHLPDSNIHDGQSIDAAIDSPVTMEVNPSYVAATQVHNINDSNIIGGRNDLAHTYDSPDPIAMEVNPAYVALAEVYTCDSSINAADVQLEENPSYIALPSLSTELQGQDVLFCSSLPVSRSAAACNL